MKKATWLGSFAICMLIGASAQAATSVFIRFKPYNKAAYVTSETQIGSKSGWEQVDDFAGSVEQVLNIGSQSTGAGAGKVVFNPVSFTLPPSSLDPTFFMMACSGTPFEQVDVEIVNGTTVVQLLHYKLVAFKTDGWIIDKATGSLKMQYSFEYGGLVIVTPSPRAGVPAVGLGWDRTKNISAPATGADLQIP